MSFTGTANKAYHQNVIYFDDNKDMPENYNGISG